MSVVKLGAMRLSTDRLLLTALSAALLSAGCGLTPLPIPGDQPEPKTDPDPELPGIGIEAEQQRPGNAEAGYTRLVNEGYVSCGLPYSVYIQAAPPVAPEELLPGRTGLNANLPYNFTAFTTKTGIDVVAPNCLVCHAAMLNGELIVGLGAHDSNYTFDASLQAELAGNFISDPTAKAEWRKWADRVSALAPYIQAPNLGVNVADNIAAVLFAHRDRDTLAWSNEPLMALPPEDPVPVDVPPWWRMRKKNAMFYSAAGRGDHARIMMTASTLCTDSVEEAEAIDAYFPDVAAYIGSLQPPAYPYAIDNALAEQGRTVFEQSCAQCHGHYGENESYPNRLIPLDLVKTDPLLATGGQFAGIYVEWFNESFYGQLSRLEPGDGYVAPPLDGIWASAPYLHNGSVPTLAALLDSTKRPTYWRRTFDSSDYDPAALGWNYEEWPHGHAGESSSSVRITIYDTTLYGYGNGGHAFGDALSEADRSALLEYLKTL